MKIPVLVLSTLITFGSVTPVQAESPIVNGIINGILNTAISSLRRDHPDRRQQPVYRHPPQRHRQVRHRDRRHRQVFYSRHRQPYLHYQYRQHPRAY